MNQTSKSFPEIIEQLINQQHLSFSQASELMTQIMQGDFINESLAAILIALRIKGETTTELTAFAKVMQDFSTKVEFKTKANFVDIVGTGGDGLHTFNISTTSAFVAAGAGVIIAKHGNRSSSGLLGSADLLEAAGINLMLSAEQVSHCVDKLGIGFMFAPNHHVAMKYVRTVRKNIGVRTVFNLLGPLTNPGNAKRQLIGVFNKMWLKPMAQCFKELGSEHCLLVHSRDGLDELSIFDINDVIELKNGVLTKQQINPNNLKLSIGCMQDITIKTTKDGLDMFYSVLNSEKSPARNIVLLNAGAAIYCSGIASSLEDGIVKAEQSIDSSKALKSFVDLKKLTVEIKKNA